MNFRLLFFFIALLGPGKQASAQYKITVSANGQMQETKAFLRYFTPEGMILDSSTFTNSKFSFTGKVPEKPTVARLYLITANETNPRFENTGDVWLENGNIEIALSKDLLTASSKGSEMQRQFSELQASLLSAKKLNRKLDELYEKSESEKNDSLNDSLLNVEYPALFVKRQIILGEFILKYPASLISAYMFDDFAGEGQMNLSVVSPVYEMLDDSIKSHPMVEKVAQRIAISQKTRPGMDAIDFSQADTSGKLIALSSLRGNYVLIDFWAGWCVPCRAENPHLIRLYKQYHSKGFEILGVSLDGERKRWTNAIITDKLPWKQVSDLNIFDNTVAKQYGINSIPQNILIDPNGKIVDWNLKGDKLDKKLEELFK